MECLWAPLHTPSSPDCSQLVPLALDYTRLSRPKPNREPVRRLHRYLTASVYVGLYAYGLVETSLKIPEYHLQGIFLYCAVTENICS